MMAVGSRRARPINRSGSGTQRAAASCSESSDHQRGLGRRRDPRGQQVGRLGGGRQGRPRLGARRRCGFSPVITGRSRAWPCCRTGPRSSRDRPTSRSRFSMSRRATSSARSPGTRRPSTAVAVTKDGTKILSGSDDKTFRVWNVADGKLLLTAPVLPAGVTAVAAAERQRTGGGRAGRWDGQGVRPDHGRSPPRPSERASRARARR